MNLILLAETFSESLARPVWEDPERFLSAGYLTMFGAIIALWRIWSRISGTLQAIRGAFEAGEVGKALLLFKEAWPSILAAFLESKKLLNKQMPPPVGPIAPQTVTPVDPIELARQQYELAKSTDDTRAMLQWKRIYDAAQPEQPKT
jgi:hypothetical protein